MSSAGDEARAMAARLRELNPKWLDARDGALFEFGNRLMAERMKPVTPVEFGTLRDSGLVDPPERTADGVQLSLGFGGAAEDYAFYVHEDLEARHAEGTGAKFLERPLLEAEPRLAEEVGDGIRRRMGMGE